MSRYIIHTFGCQMNKHDSERMAGLLQTHGYMPAVSDADADVIIFNTCAVRETADDRLYGQVASLKALKTGGRPEVIIAVGGCVGQRDGERMLQHLPHVDVVFGTHNIHELPSLIDAAAYGRSVARVLEGTETFASDLPTVREHAWHAWVPINVGCDNHCAYCIVPTVRGPERSRVFEDVVTEVAALVAEGVIEVTLLGQNVNSYGRDRYGQPRFAELLHAVAATGIPRIRFATSHPKDLSDDTIRALAELPALMPYLHLPVQHGSNAVLAAMNRRYTRETYLDRIERLRAAVPDITLSTDIIVGFPGETDADFEQTLDLYDRVAFDHAFTFIYSSREGTPAAALTTTVPREISQQRFDRLAARVRDLSFESNRRVVGRTQECLVEGASRKDRHVLSARTPHNRLVHVPVPEGRTAGAYAGTLQMIRVTGAHPWFLTGELDNDAV
ncbi:MAG: tRNA (N6-isopentenyl adenosine(37)-C2)-methylthiotransferase MiaB [Coriobacteriia bacterium]|nr:tRNA (N6-isopentenyl adenosine(37)-C2)-methylthiotransferase MiaB [Coriobacteriia bacterium]MBN2840923.1 tRNA (N6-isopentenyl adenosine(37)-C2)-methylthiotransferase MiaB [Coriobacteriia bacterium]